MSLAFLYRLGWEAENIVAVPGRSPERQSMPAFGFNALDIAGDCKQESEGQVCEITAYR